MVQSVGFFSLLKGRFEGLCYPVSWGFVAKNLPCLQAKLKKTEGPSNFHNFLFVEGLMGWSMVGMKDTHYAKNTQVGQ